MAKKGARARSMKDQYEHSYDHRGDSGMFGTIFTEDVPAFIPANKENELMVVPFLCSKNGPFRMKNPEMNKPFSKEDLKSGNAYAYKLTALIHRNCGPNRDTKLCLKTLKETCPRCEERDRLRSKREALKKKNKNTDHLDEQMRELSPAKRAIYNVLSFNSRKDRKKGIMVWMAPHASIEDVVIERARDRRSGEFKDFAIPEAGYNIVFDKQGTGLTTEYKDVDVVKRREEDELSEKEMKELYDQAYYLDEIVEIPTAEELYELTHGVKPGEEREEEEEEEEHPRKRRRDEEEEEEERPKKRSRKDDEEEEEEEEEDSEEEEDEEEEEEEERPKKRKKKIEEEDEEEEEGDEKQPKCFGVKFQEIDDCEDCPTKTFRACMKASEEEEEEERPKKRPKRR